MAGSSRSSKTLPCCWSAQQAVLCALVLMSACCSRATLNQSSATTPGLPTADEVYTAADAQQQQQQHPVLLSSFTDLQHLFHSQLLEQDEVQQQSAELLQWQQQQQGIAVAATDSQQQQQHAAVMVVAGRKLPHKAVPHQNKQPKQTSKTPQQEQKQQHTHASRRWQRQQQQRGFTATSLHSQQLPQSPESTSVEQQQHQQQRSSLAPVVNGWNNLVTTSNVIFTWSHQLFPLDSSALTVPWWGSEVAKARATFTRTVASSQYFFSGNLQITNPDAMNSMWINQVQLQCLWGATVNLPCGSLGRQYGALQIAAGQTVTCYVNNMYLSAGYGSNFRQPCRAIATSWNGVEATSEAFFLDFDNPIINNQANNCILFSMNCAVTATPHYNPSLGGLPQNQLLCDANPSVEFDVALGGGFVGDGTGAGACTSPARIDCSSQGVMTSTIGVPPGSGSTISSTLAFTATPTQCPAPPPAVPPPLPPAAPVVPPPAGFQDRLDPELSITVTKTYIVGAYTWGLTTSVVPSSFQVYQGSSAAARYAIPITRTLSNNPAPRYLVDGVITVTNPNSQPIAIQSVSAALPWNVLAAASCSNLNLPGTLNPGAIASCTFRLTYDLGPKPSQVLAQAYLAGRNAPVTSDRAAFFDFEGADDGWSSGTCAGVEIAYIAEPGLALSLLAGGKAPAVAGAGQPSTELCGSTAFDFSVQFTPGATLRPGVSKVSGRVTVTPISGSQGAIESTAFADVEVLEWPASWGLKAMTASAQMNTTRIRIPTTRHQDMA